MTIAQERVIKQMRNGWVLKKHPFFPRTFLVNRDGDAKLVRRPTFTRLLADDLIVEAGRDDVGNTVYKLTARASA